MAQAVGVQVSPSTPISCKKALKTDICHLMSFALARYFLKYPLATGKNLQFLNLKSPHFFIYYEKIAKLRVTNLIIEYSPAAIAGRYEGFQCIRVDSNAIG